MQGGNFKSSLDSKFISYWNLSKIQLTIQKDQRQQTLNKFSLSLVDS